MFNDDKGLLIDEEIALEMFENIQMLIDGASAYTLKYDLQSEDVDSLQKIFYLFQDGINHAPNEITTLINKMNIRQRKKRYSLKRIDAEGIEETHYEKTLRGIIKKFRKKTILGDLKEKSYTARNILYYILASSPIKKDKEIHTAEFQNFYNKYNDHVKKIMTAFRVKVSRFKNSSLGSKFINKYGDGYYATVISEDKLDRIIKYSLHFNRLSTKEDVEYLSGIIDLATKAPTKQETKEQIIKELRA